MEGTGASFKSYRDLQVWQKAMSLVREVYSETHSFPEDERFGLISQMRRCAISIPSNLAEGHARVGSGDFQRFISIALGSAAELETQLILCADLGYLSPKNRDALLAKLDVIGKMLRGLYKSIAKVRTR